MTTTTRAFLRAAVQDWRRSLPVAAAIALGIAAFTAVLAAYAILTRALDDGYEASTPAHATLWLDEVDPSVLDAVRAQPGVEVAEARRALSGRIAAQPRGWRNLVLFVAEDLGATKVSRVAPFAGSWPPAPGELLIERDALQVAGLAIGDDAKVALTDGGQATLRIAGSVHDVGQAQARMEHLVYGYVDRATLRELGLEPTFDRLLIRFVPAPTDLAAAQRATDALLATLAAQGRQISRFDVPEPGEHPHAQLMGSLLLAKAGFGLAALLLSGILVVNLLTARMSAQVRQIGVLKTLGGTRGQIARLYWSQALMLSVAALAAGLPLGLWGSRLLSRWQGRFLNFDVVDFTPPWWVYLAVVAVGLVFPQAAAAWPIWRSAGISVRRALIEQGVAPAFAQGRVDGLLRRLAGSRSAPAYVLRNLFRQRARTWRTLGTLAVAGLLFLSALNLRASMMATIEKLFEGRKYDVTVSFAELMPRAEVEALLRATPGVRAAEGWVASRGVFADDAAKEAPAAHGAGRPQGGHGAGHGGGGRGFTVLAIPAETELLTLDLIEGRTLAPGDETAIVVNSAFAERYPTFRVGDEVGFQLGHFDTKWRLVGIAREPMTQPTVYLPRLFYDNRHPDRASTFRVALERSDADAIDAAKDALEVGLRAAGLNPRSIAGKAEGRISFDQHLVMIYNFLMAMAGLLAAVGLLGLATATSLNVGERLRELAVLRMLGASPTRIRHLLVAESCLIALGAWLVAVALAVPIGGTAGALLVAKIFPGGLDRVLEPWGAIVWLALSLLLGAVAAIVPALRAGGRPLSDLRDPV